MAAPIPCYLIVLTNLDPPYGVKASKWKCGVTYHSDRADRLTLLHVQVPDSDRPLQDRIADAYRAYAEENGSGADSLPTIIDVWRVEEVPVDGFSITAKVKIEKRQAVEKLYEDNERRQLAALLAKYPDAKPEGAS